MTPTLDIARSERAGGARLENLTNRIGRAIAGLADNISTRLWVLEYERAEARYWAAKEQRQ